MSERLKTVAKTGIVAVVVVVLTALAMRGVFYWVDRAIGPRTQSTL